MADELDIPMPSMMPAGAATWRNVRRREALDSSTRRLVLFAGVIGGGLLLLVGAWSLGGHRSTAVPVIEADARPLRTKPENPGGMQLAGQDDAILSGSSGGQDGMAPPPEAPAPQALAAPPPPTPLPASIPASSPATSPTPAPAVAEASAPALAPVAPARAAPPQAAPAAVTTPRAVALPKVVTGGPQVQLAALVTEEAATAEWQRLTKRMPELMGGRSPIVTRLDRSDGKVFWRLRTGGFSDIAQATAFCEKVRAKGIGCALGSS